ncbi:MAG: BatA domain-containing protein [Planctomycetota bacterium]|nr:BatA domain-containing protein [Planctomycetota bacterium]
MGLVNASLIVGGLLAAVPIALHLLMRPKPQSMVFPAIRFVRNRRESNVRKLQLRHWLLLALRCLIIVLLALSLARPSVVAASYGRWLVSGFLSGLLLLSLTLSIAAHVHQKHRGIVLGMATTTAVAFILLATSMTYALRGRSILLTGNRLAPVATALIFDTSLRMDYRTRNQTRLEVACEMGHWVVEQLPQDSQVAIRESRMPDGPNKQFEAPAFCLNHSGAQRAIQRLQTTGHTRSLWRVIEESINLLARSELSQQEIFVFTDFTRSAWLPEEEALRIGELLRQQEHIVLHIIDVGVTQPQNVRLGNIKLSTQTTALHQPLDVSVSLHAIGLSGQRTLELAVEEANSTGPLVQDEKTILPVATIRGQQLVNVDNERNHTTTFPLPQLPIGIHHGRISLVEPDGLPADNQRYFTFEVRDPWSVLIVAPKNVNTHLFTEALSPQQEASRDDTSYNCAVVQQAALTAEQLSDFAVIVFLDPKPLSLELWQSLAAYIRDGGNTAFFLGPNADPADPFNRPVAQELLPAKLARQTRAGNWNLFLQPEQLQHPALATFRDIPPENVPWQLYPVFRHWDLEPLHPTANVIIRFGNKLPALVERPVGQGRVLVMATPISEIPRPSGRDPWNELAGANDWPRFALINDLAGYLTQHDSTPALNYQVGDHVVLSNDSARQPDRYQLFVSDDEPYETLAQQETISIRYTQQHGTYRLKGQRGGLVLRGFSVNIPSQETDLQRLEDDALAGWLGPDRFHLARKKEAIEVDIRQAREGRELYPLLILALVLVLAIEHLLANRFYRDRTASSEVLAPTS